MKVAIVGGGIGGMTLAAALHKLGIEAHIYEQAPEIREVGAAVGLWGNSLGSLDQIGAGDAVRHACTPIHRAQVVSASRGVLNSVDIADFATSYVVYRPLLLDAIKRAVPAECIHTGCRAKSIVQNIASARVRFSNCCEIEADVVVGADGLHSLVRGAVLPDNSLRYFGQTCFRGIAPIAPFERGVMREIHGPGRRIGIAPVSDRMVYWFTAHNAEPSQLLPQSDRKDFLLRFFKDWPFGFERYIEATPADAILQNDLYDRRPVNRWSKGRITLLGDAAHPTTPNLGQGANMAIDDAIVLARSLATSATIAAAFRRYESIRIGRTSAIVQKSYRFGRFCLWSHPTLVRLRESMLRLTPRSVVIGQMKQQMIESVGPLY